MVLSKPEHTLFPYRIAVADSVILRYTFLVEQWN